MPFGSKPCCISCKATSAALWRRDAEKNIICNNCFNKPAEKEDSENGSNGAKPHSRDRSAVGSQYIGPIRKSARLKPTRHKYQSLAKTFATKGKSRRIIFKKNPIKSAPSVSTVVTSDYIFYDGIYWQIGDIASVMDEDDGGIYYVQLRGFLQDQYGAKSAVITWLLPTLESPQEGFDSSTFILGPEEELPRNMECFEFVCRAPSDYFQSKVSPYPTDETMRPELGYVWTSMGHQIMSVPSNDEIYGLKKDEPPEKIEKLTGKERKGRKRDKGEPVVKKEKKETAKEKKEREAATTTGSGKSTTATAGASKSAASTSASSKSAAPTKSATATTGASKTTGTSKSTAATSVAGKGNGQNQKAPVCKSTAERRGRRAKDKKTSQSAV